MYLILLNFLTTALSLGILKLLQYFSVGVSNLERGLLIFIAWLVILVLFLIFKFLAVKNLDDYLVYTAESLFLEGVILLVAVIFVFAPSLIFRINQSVLDVVIDNFYLCYFCYSVFVKFLSSRVFAVPFLTLGISIPIALSAFNGFANYFVLLNGGNYVEFFSKDLILAILSFDLPLIAGVIFYGSLAYILLKEKRF